MPELPEVETVLRGFRGRIRGRRIVRAQAFTPKLRVPVPKDFSEVLEGNAVRAITRRAKFLRLHLERGPVVLFHLGMSGSIRLEHAAQPFRAVKHDHALLEFEGNVRLVFNDPRRFGLIAFADPKHLAAHPFFKNLGPEPLSRSFNGKVLRQALAKRNTAVKLALLDQTVVAGVGNIYASEALFRARINPRRRPSSLNDAEAERLAEAVRAVLKSAIASGGSSLRNFSQVDGALGEFQHKFQVYEREDKRCVRRGCSGVIKRIVQGARSTYFCPLCQRRV